MALKAAFASPPESQFLHLRADGAHFPDCQGHMSQVACAWHLEGASIHGRPPSPPMPLPPGGLCLVHPTIYCSSGRPLGLPLRAASSPLRNSAGENWVVPSFSASKHYYGTGTPRVGAFLSWLSGCGPIGGRIEGFRPREEAVDLPPPAQWLPQYRPDSWGGPTPSR